MGKKIKALLSAIAVFSVIFLCSCGADMPESTVYSLGDMEGKIIGVMANTAAEDSVEKSGIAGEIKIFYDTGKLAEALKTGAIDCAVVDSDAGERVRKSERKLRMLDEPFSDQGYRIAVPKGNDVLFEMIEAALKDLKNEGVVDDIVTGWLEDEKSVYVPAALGNEAETIAVGIAPGLIPYEFYGSDGVITGLEIDILKAVCDRLGIEPEIQAAEWDEMLYMAESGKVSLAIGRLTETSSDSVVFTETYLTAQQYVLVRG